MIKKSVSLVAVSALALGLSACGKSGSSSSTSTSTSSGVSGSTIASTMTFGGPPEFQTRTDGLPGITKNYGATFGKVVVTDAGGPVTVNQLKNGQIQAANLFSTDPSIKANNFVILEDPKHNFAAQNIVPIIAKSKAKPGVTEVLNSLSAKLTTADLGTMVGQVQNDHKDASAVAQAWLKTAGLDTTSTKASGVNLTIGSANFTESQVLANVYAVALKAAGANVSTTLGIGSREKYFPALKSGSLDLMPEYDGAVLQYLDKNATAVSRTDVDAALTKALPTNLEALKSSEAADSDAIVVTKATADKYSLKTIGDLAKSAK